MHWDENLLEDECLDFDVSIARFAWSLTGHSLNESCPVLYNGSTRTPVDDGGIQRLHDWAMFVAGLTLSTLRRADALLPSWSHCESTCKPCLRCILRLFYLSPVSKGSVVHEWFEPCVCTGVVYICAGDIVRTSLPVHQMACRYELSYKSGNSRSAFTTEPECTPQCICTS